MNIYSSTISDFAQFMYLSKDHILIGFIQIKFVGWIMLVPYTTKLDMFAKDLSLTNFSKLVF